MKQVTYRVEAFIIPTGNEHSPRYNDPVQTKFDNMKVKCNQANSTTVNIEKNKSSYEQNEKNDLLSMEKENMQNLENCIALENIETNLSDKNKVKKNNSVNFYSCLDIPRTKYKVLYNAGSGCFSSNVLDKVCRLSTIDEKNEDSERKLTEICYHGCRNGCSATVPTPQEVTEEIFKENWLQRLEDIKQKEAILRNREINLQHRERIIFKKEREIKILECLLKDKLKQIDLYLKEKHLQELLKVNNVLKNVSESRISIDPKELHNEIYANDDSAEGLNNTGADKLNLSLQTVQIQDRFDNEIVQIHKHADTVGTTCKDLQQEKASISSSSCSSDNSVPEGKRSKKRLNSKNSVSLKSSSKFTHNSNSKMKIPCKVSYEDLDTTLSADVGDSSFVQTSEKFNPELYRKPYAFTRSVSERRGKYMNNGSDTNLEIQKLDNPKEEFQAPTGIAQNKVLKRVTQNISASQDKSTKFQHYGLIDHNVDTNKVHRIENEEKYSYLNLETSNRLCSHPKLLRSFKDRPISWNEETNEWLQKKRKAYNMTMKKTVSQESDNKENLKYNTKTSKSEKVPAKKDIKTKIRTIFR